jgi:hypothetical protein
MTATTRVVFDCNTLLVFDLMDVTKPEAAEFQKRYPSLRILDPIGFLREVASQP